MTFWSADGLTAKIVGSILILVAAALARVVAGRFIRSHRWASAEDARRWLVRARNVTVLLVLLGLVIVWAEELRAAAFSLVAFAVAFVIAGREIFLAISGSFIRAASGSFTVGDRVRIGPHRGDVIDHSLLSTTLLEIGAGHVRTGRTLVLPNSLLLTEAIANETRGHQCVLHSFSVPVARAEWRYAQDILLSAAIRYSEDYVDEARSQMERRANEYSLSMPIVDPFVLAKPTTVDTVEMTVRVPVRAREAWRVEHDITQAWLAEVGGESREGSAAGHGPDEDG